MRVRRERVSHFKATLKQSVKWIILRRWQIAKWPTVRATTRRHHSKLNYLFQHKVNYLFKHLVNYLFRPKVNYLFKALVMRNFLHKDSLNMHNFLHKDSLNKVNSMHKDNIKMVSYDHRCQT